MVHGKNGEIHNSSLTISLFIISVKVKSLLIEIPKTLFLVANISDLITLQVNCFAIDKMIYIWWLYSYARVITKFQMLGYSLI